MGNCEMGSSRIPHSTIWITMESGEKSVETDKKYDRMARILVLILTMLYAVVVFFRLGSTKAPQTYLSFQTPSAKERRIEVSFADEIKLDRIDFYLGEQSKRTVTVSSYKQKKGKWKILEENQLLKTPFAWNSVSLKRIVQTVAIDFLDEEVQIFEIVFVDSEGNRVLPENWQEYEAVFDEQELHPEYATYYEGTMFDEAYYDRTAYELIHGLPLFEKTHPPLGKILISLGVLMFGMTPFGWRFACACFGVAMVPLMYAFAKRISGQQKFALFAAFLFCLEFMHLTLSRIATLDSIVAFFVLGMFYWMYDAIVELKKDAEICQAKNHQSENPQLETSQMKSLRKVSLNKKVIGELLVCGFFSGCAVATKWTGCYALAGIGVLFLGFVWMEFASSWGKLRQNIGFLLKLCGICIVVFVLIPISIYVLSYLPYLRCEGEQNLLKVVMDNTKMMFSYHVNADFFHAYSSEWYEWLWDKRPFLDSYRKVADGKVSSVATFGNPVIWWSGLAAWLHNLYLGIWKKDRTAVYLCVSYLAMLVPWMFIHRTVFIYQYYICSIILVLLLTYSFYRMNRYQKRVMFVFTLIAMMLFFMYLPVLTGYPVNPDYVNGWLEWMKSWELA